MGSKTVKNCLGYRSCSGSTQNVPIVLKNCRWVLLTSLLRITEHFLASDHFFVSYSLDLGSEICVWDRKYAEKIISPISSYLIQNYLCMCPDQCEWIWDRFFTFHLRKVVLGSENPIFGIEKTKFAKTTELSKSEVENHIAENNAILHQMIFDVSRSHSRVSGINYQ